MLIVVEGKSDEEFLSQYMLYKNIQMPKFIQNGGNSLGESTITQIEKHLDDKEKVCIIFDADTSYINTLDGLKNKLGNLANKVNIFLFPNNKDSGELETLLINIAKQSQFVECFDGYVKCVKSKDKDIVGNINKKSKMFAYREVSGLEKYLKKLKDDDKTPKNLLETNKIFSQYFNFDSLKLKPLSKFLCG